MKDKLWKSFLVTLVLLSIPATMVGGVLRSSSIRAASASFEGTITQGILILVHGSAGTASELSLVKGPLENWGYPVEVFDHTEYYDLAGNSGHWYLHDQGGGHGNLDLVVDGNMQYSVIIFDSADGVAYTDVETPSRLVKQMFEQYPFLGIARMEGGYTLGSVDNLFQVSTDGSAAKSLTISNPTGIPALQPMVGYQRSGTFRNISGKTDNVTVLESYLDGTPALTLTSYDSGAHAVYFSFKDWGYPAHVSMLVRLVQQYSGIPYIKPYYSFEVDDCGDPEVNGHSIFNKDYMALLNWTKSNLGGYPTLGFVQRYLDPNPTDNVFVYGLNPCNYYSNNLSFNPDNVDLMAALGAYDDYVVASHGYQHNVDWWQWTATGIPLDPYGDEDGDGDPNWEDDDLENAGVNNNDNPNLSIYSAGAFTFVDEDLAMQRRWFSRMREVLDSYGFPDATVFIAPKFHYLDGDTNDLASEYGFGVISGRAWNEGFEMTLGWFHGTYAPGRVSPSGVGSDPDIALSPAQISSFSAQFMGYIGEQPMCLVTNHVWQFAGGDTANVYELRNSYLSSYNVMTQAGFTLVSTQTAANKNIGWLWTDMSSVRNSTGSINLTLDSSAFLDGKARHELDIVMPFSIREVKVGSNYSIYVNGNTLFYGKQSGSSETLEVLGGTYNTSLPRISSVSTPATDVLKAIYDPTSGKISLMLDGTFATTLNINNFNKPFLQGTTSIGSNGNSALTMGLAGVSSTDSVNMSIIPSSGHVDVAVQEWSITGDRFRQWTESSTSTGISTMHTVGDLVPNQYYSIRYTKDGESKTHLQTLPANAAGQISFNYDRGYSTVTFELNAAEGPNQAPDQPENILPANGAVGLSLTPTLQSSDFSDPDAEDTHGASQWQVAAVAGDYSSPVFDSQEDTLNLVSIIVPADRLGHSTTYFWRVRHRDYLGEWSNWSAETSFTTYGTAPAVTTGAASNLTITSATLNGSLTSLGTAGSVIVSFAWGTTAGGPYPNVTDNQTMNSTGAFTAALTGLSAGTTYYYKANAAGDGTALGNEVSFVISTTPPTVTTSAATNLAVASATLNGNLGSLGTAAGVSVSFEWGASTSYGSQTTGQSLTAAGAFTASLSGLTANTTYHFRAKAVGHGAAVYGEDMTFTTASLSDTTAPVIYLVSSSGITKSGATIIWTTNESATSRVEYGLTEEYGSFTTLDTNMVTSHSVELTGLEAGKTHHFRVISEDASGNEAVSSDFTFETEASSGGMPVWAWVLIGLAVVAVAGAAAFLIKGRLEQG